MRVSVIGTGHVGLTTAVCLAHVGHEVVGVDDDAEKVATIGRGDVPFHEPGLSDLLREGLDTGRLRVSTDLAHAARRAEVSFVCVGTPTKPSGEANLVQVERVATILARNIDGTAGYLDTKTYLLGKNADGTNNTMTPGGTYKRHTFSAMARVTNLSQRKETPL